MELVLKLKLTALKPRAVCLGTKLGTVRPYECVDRVALEFIAAAGLYSSRKGTEICVSYISIAGLKTCCKADGAYCTDLWCMYSVDHGDETKGQCESPTNVVRTSERPRRDEELETLKHLPCRKNHSTS